MGIIKSSIFGFKFVTTLCFKRLNEQFATSRFVQCLSQMQIYQIKTRVLLEQTQQ